LSALSPLKRAAGRALRLAVAQYECGADREANLRAAAAGLAEARRRGAELALLPELAALPYFCMRQEARRFDLAEPVPGPTTERLGREAARLGMVIVTTVFERRQGGLYHNTAVALDRDGTLAGRYRKMHIPEEAGYHEKYYFSPGDDGFRPIETSLGRLGVLICWDQWFPEAARLMALAGAELLLYPSAIGWDPSESEAERHRQTDAWLTVQRGHAIANGLPVATGNRTGLQREQTNGGGTRFWGAGFIAGAQGEILAQAPADGAAVITAEIDLGRSEKLRREWPFLRDRRIDAYGDLLRRGR